MILLYDLPSFREIEAFYPNHGQFESGVVFNHRTQAVWLGGECESDFSIIQ